MATMVRPISDIFTPYVLEMPVSEKEEDGTALAVVLVVIRKPSAVLLAVPQDYFPADALEEGQVAGPEDMLGPSTIVPIAGGRLATMDGSPPVLEDGVEMDVVLVDMSPDILDHLTLVSEFSGPTDLLHLFLDDPFVYPMKEELLAAAWEWLTHPEGGDRLHYYSAEEVDENEEEMIPEAPPNGPRAFIQPGAKPAATPTPGGKKPRAQNQQPKVKKPTIAQLATSMESILTTLPVLTKQMEELSVRTKAMEASSRDPRTSALSRPLGDSGTLGSQGASTVTPAALLKEMPPPQAASRMRQLPLVPTSGEADALALTEEHVKDVDPTDMLKAMFAQSSAVTALAAQIANFGGDSLGELSMGTSSLSSKGVSGRMKLQQELALHKGTFFNAVMANMSRRMNPASPADSSPMELLNKGVCMTKYVERFGGFGKAREMGFVMWQVAMIMDYLQSENWMGARDAAALLSVCLEQTALDSSMDVGLLLALVEDPPAGLFTNRSLAPLSRGRSFAPLADQRWVATALSFIKELDLISQRRADVTGTKASGSTDGLVVAPKQKPKPQPKGAWKKKQKQITDGAEV